METKVEGIIIKPNDQDMEIWCDADFCGNWNADTAQLDWTMAKSRTGYIVKYPGCPVTWTSKMQRDVASSPIGKSDSHELRTEYSNPSNEIIARVVRSRGATDKQDSRSLLQSN